MKKYFNNKGSTMILLVMAIAVISLLGTSILGVTMMNLKIKKTNTEIKQSFYLSESGLDKSYSKAYALVQKAVEGGNDKAKTFIDMFRMDNIEVLKNNLPYSLCLDTNIEEGEDGTSTVVYSFNEEEIKTQAGEIFKDYFRNYIKTTNYDNNHNNIIDELEGIDGGLTVSITNKSTLDFVGDDLELDIDSLYINDKNIQKITSVKLVLKVPEYNEPYTVSTEVIPVNPFWTKVLTAKNLYINSDTEVTGNVYVSENLNVDGTSITPKFNSKLAVKGDINLNGGNSTTNVKDVYANNILIYGSGAKLSANCSTIKDSINYGSGIFVKDDLEINESNQKVLINGSYYGFSDGSANPAPDHSSGININTFDTSNVEVEIKGDVYLHGTSYVDLVNSDNDKYQTGESVSIKGNYRAYMEPLIDSSITPEHLRIDNVNFRDYGYLTFVNSFKNNDELTAMDKALYLYYYNQEYSGLGLNLLSNIKLAESGTVYSIGSTIINGVLNEANYDVEDTEVYNLAEDIYYLENQKLGDDTANLSSEESNGLEFDTQVNFNGLSEKIDINDGTNLIYINNDVDDTYNLTSGTYKGLIVTSGDIRISGDVNFTGAIVCGKDIIMNDSLSKTFKYDRNIVAKIIAEHNLHRTVFKQDTSTNTTAVTKFVTQDTADDEIVNVDFSNLLKFNDWKIK